MTCPDCNAEFSTAEILDGHRKVAHAGPFAERLRGAKTAAEKVVVVQEMLLAAGDDESSAKVQAVRTVAEMLGVLKGGGAETDEDAHRAMLERTEKALERIKDVRAAMRKELLDRDLREEVKRVIAEIEEKERAEVPA